MCKRVLQDVKEMGEMERKEKEEKRRNPWESLFLFPRASFYLFYLFPEIGIDPVEHVPKRSQQSTEIWGGATASTASEFHTQHSFIPAGIEFLDLFLTAMDDCVAPTQMLN